VARVLRRASVSAPIPLEEPPSLAADPEPPRPPVAEFGQNSVSKLRTTVVSLLATLVAGTAFAIAYDGQTASHLFPGTRIGGVVVGSRSVIEADALITERVVRPLQTDPVNVRADETIRTSAWDMGVRIDVGNAVRDVHKRQQEAPFLTRLWRRVLGEEHNNPLRADISQPRLRAFVDQTAQRIDREMRDATVEIHGPTLKVVPHQVGRTLDKQGSVDRIVGALRSGDRDIELPVAITEPTLRTEAFAKVIYVRTGSNTLDLYLDGKVSRSYRVATGTPGYPTPHGQFRITAKRRNPTWGNPWAPWSMNMPAFIGPGPDNPLGTRALNLSVSGIRIHGSPDAASIGGPASHGCIRMHMRQAEELFELVDVDTPVVIVGG